jgi:hypothetical protein
MIGFMFIYGQTNPPRRAARTQPARDLDRIIGVGNLEIWHQEAHTRNCGPRNDLLTYIQTRIKCGGQKMPVRATSFVVCSAVPFRLLWWGDWFEMLENQPLLSC